MDNFYSAFMKKVEFVTKMVDYYKEYKTPAGFFLSSKSTSDENRLNSMGTHIDGTTFKYFSLIDEYKDEFDRILKACAIDYTTDKDGNMHFFEVR